MQIINRYLRTHIIAATTLVVIILAAIDAFMLFFAQTNDLGTQYTMFLAFLYVLMQIPFDIYQYFPMAGFLGCLIGLGRLARTSELVVMRAGGISVFEITCAVIKTALIMLVVVTAVGEGLSPVLQDYSEHMKASALGKAKKYVTLGWLREKDHFIHIGEIVSPKIVRDITVFDIKNHQLHSTSYAPRAIKLDSGFWQMRHVVTSVLAASKIEKKESLTQNLAVKFDPVSVVLGEKSIEQLSVAGLYKTVKYRESAGLDTRQYRYTFWQRVFQPLVSVIMICLGVPFVFGSLRQSSMGLKVMLGVIGGFAFYTVNQVVGPLSIVYQISLIVGALIPVVISLLACVILYRRI